MDFNKVNKMFTKAQYSDVIIAGSHALAQYYLTNGPLLMIVGGSTGITTSQQ